MNLRVKNQIDFDPDTLYLDSTPLMEFQAD